MKLLNYGLFLSKLFLPLLLIKKQIEAGHEIIMKFMSMVVFVAILIMPLTVAAQTHLGVKTDTADAIIAEAERISQLRIPMRDGILLNADILFPKKAKEGLPTILVRTPYNFQMEIDGLKDVLARLLQEGYAVIVSHERGRYYSEGTYTFLNGAYKDGYDTIDWIVNQQWSNGKVGTIGCSSSAEHQLGMAVMDHPGHAAMIPIAPGAGIGNIGPYKEQGNFYRGGVWQGLWLSWYYEYGWRHRPSLPQSLSHSERELLGKYFDLNPSIPKIDMDKAVWGLPLKDLPASINAMPSDLYDFIQRQPGDPRWSEQEFVREGDQFGVPSLWVFSWYDIPTPVNIAFVNHQRKIAKTITDRQNQFMIIGPTTHCKQGTESEQTIVGERNVGDARFDYLEVFVDWFDYWLKGKENGVTERAKNVIYTMGSNEWQEFEMWPPKDIRKEKYYLHSSDGANSRLGDGVLQLSQPTSEGADSFSYDPSTPVPSLGGSVCCFSDDFKGGSFDQSAIEMRNDVLVYTTVPFEKGIEVTGEIEVHLFLSSDVVDTDLTVKILVMEKDGKAYNLDDSIQRVRYRNGYDKPEFMESGNIYKISIGPLATSNYFAPGQSLRIEISSSNFPRFGRNLNTGGNNYDEAEPVVAHNKIHHSQIYPSHLIIPVRSRE